jgi:SAM-dependent methyltransferase
MDAIELLSDFHREGRRQGPGSDAATLRALELSAIDREVPLAVADIGCGTGASTLVLAEALNGRITAVDFLQDFLDELERRAADAGLAERISALACSMDALPFDEQSLDLIWAEGSIYNIGFEQGVRDWRPFLREGGVLVASEITWLTDKRPAELDAHWQAAYPEIDTASNKLAALERQGYTPIGYFVLPRSCWFDEYYGPMQERFEAFLQRHGSTQQAEALVASEREEIRLYERFQDYYSYGVYIAQKSSAPIPV